MEITLTDIVERLRGKPVRHDYFPEADRQEAADEIERLRQALQEIVDSIAAVGPAAPMLERARRALEHKP
jgi:hypothetical protein